MNVQLFTNIKNQTVINSGEVIQETPEGLVCQFGINRVEFTKRSNGEFVQKGTRAEKGNFIRTVLVLAEKIVEKVTEAVAPSPEKKVTKMAICLELLKQETEKGNASWSVMTKLFMADERLNMKRPAANTYLGLVRAKLNK
jgi:hypothetical protein